MRLLCFGDSNTYGHDPRSYLGERYPAETRWTGRLETDTGWEVLEEGQNGREIPSRASERKEVEEMLSRTGRLDVLLVMLGGNDLLQHPDFTAEDVSTRMERFLTAILPHSSLAAGTVFLIAPPPMRPGAWVTERRLLTESARLADCYQALARQLGISFADAGQWGVDLLFDGVHFSEAGHWAFAEGLRLVLEDWEPGQFRKN